MRFNNSSKHRSEARCSEAHLLWGVPAEGQEAYQEQIRKGAKQETLSKEQMASHEDSVMPNDVAALSVGMVEGQVWTDLDYVLDSNADVDMNVVMTSSGDFVEVQGPVRRRPTPEKS